MATPQKRRGTWYAIPGDVDCEHGPIIRLGADVGNNEYYQCQTCETALVREGHVDPREIREQHQNEHQGGSNNLFLDALDVDDTLGGDKTGQHRSEVNQSSSSPIAVWIRKIRRRIFEP